MAQNQPATFVAIERLNLGNINSVQKFAQVKNSSHLCGANKLNVLHYAKVLSNNKKAAYGCKSRDFSIYIELVSGDRLSFINSKTF